MDLATLLANLDRDDVTELVIGTSRPPSVKTGGTLVPLQKEDTTKIQLGKWLLNTPFEPLIPEAEGQTGPTEVVAFGRAVRVHMARRGKDLVCRFERGASAAGSGVRIAKPPSDASLRVPAPAAPRTPVVAPALATPAAAARPARQTKRNLRRQTRDPLLKATSSGAPPPPPTVGFELGDDLASFEVDLATTKPGAPIATPPPPGTAAPVKPAPARELMTPPRASSAAPARSFDFELEGGLDGLDLAGPATPPPAAPAPKPAGSSPAIAPTPAPVVIAASAAPVKLDGSFATLVQTARARGASDIHVSAHRPLMIRAIGELVPLEPRVWSAQEAEALLLPLVDLAGPSGRADLAARGYVDIAVELATGGVTAPGTGAARVRGNISRQQGGLKGSFRLAFPRPPTLEELHLPNALAKVVSHHQGLVVLAGPSGHGKTTTLAALVDLINSTRASHILSIEDPVEIEHPRKQAVISQREVGKHTRSFAAALKASLREDPDVIVIGELRDRESVEIALTAAETGHLVMSTMSTPSAAKTIDRLIDMFPPDDQSQVRASLAGALRAIVAQRLLPRADGAGVLPAVELLTGVLPLAALIRDNRLFQLPNLMQRGRAFGMIRLDDSLLELVRAGSIAEELALRLADNKKELAAALHPQAAATPAAAAPAKKPGLGGLFNRGGGDR